MGAKMLQRPAEPYLREQNPEVYGGLGGLMGMAPDEMGGSVLDPNTARVKAGAQIGFPVGTALQVAPLAPMLATGAKATARALGPTAVRMGEGYLQRQGLMPGAKEPGMSLSSLMDNPQGLANSIAEQKVLAAQAKVMKNKAFLDLSTKEKAQALDSVRAKIEKTGVVRKKSRSRVSIGN